MACHWGSTLRRYNFVPLTLGTYLYPCGLYLTETNLVPQVAILYPYIEIQKWTFKKGTKLAFIGYSIESLIIILYILFLHYTKDK